MTFVAELLGTGTIQAYLLFDQAGTKISIGIYDIAKSLTIPGWIVIATLLVQSVYMIAVGIERWLTYNKARQQSRQYAPKVAMALKNLAGVVRVHTEAKTLKLKPLIGCKIETVEGLAFLAYPVDRAAYGRLCRLISAGRMQTLDGEWQEKGACDISLAMLADHADGVQLILLPPRELACEFTVPAWASNVVGLDRKSVV